MNDEEALGILRETLENAKKITESHPNAFYTVYLLLAEDLLRMSQHFQSNKFRLWTYYFWVTGNLFKGYFDIAFQNRVVEKLKTSFEEEEDIRREPILNVVSRFLSVSALSDAQGRDVVNIEELNNAFAEELKGQGLDESTKILTIFKVANAIREVFDSTSFINDTKTEMVGFYNRLIDSSEKGWTEVYDALHEYVIKWDKVAVIWKHEGV